VADFTTDYLALRGDAGAVRLPRDVIRVHGPDALSFLQGQLSQDVEALADGGSAWSLLLQPQGKVDALVRVTRLAADDHLLDVDEGYGDRVVERLLRFKLRVKADVERAAFQCLALRGPRSHEAAATVAEHGALLLDADWPGLAGVDLIGTDPALPSDVPECGLDAYEAVRIEAGVPVMGREVTDRTIPAELGILERAVSFTKGCFTGQELVARMDARGGQAPRQLRGVVVGTNLIPPVGARLLLDGREVGTLTSVSESLERRAPIALANVSRAVEPPADVVVTWDGGEVPARVETLPLVP
jgi:folate-binding protein YgfZ